MARTPAPAPAHPARRSTRCRALPALAAPCLLALAPAACTTTSESDLAPRPVYPLAAAASTKVLDVQVFREDTVVRMTNTSGRAFGPCRMWINKWYSRPLDGLAPGQTLTLDLDSFKDRYGTPFRAGGFFATERSDRVVLCQIEDGSELVGLLLVNAPVE